MKKDFYSIGEAAELLGVTATTLRNWEKAGKLVGTRDSKNSYRKYSYSQILSLKHELEEPSIVLSPTPEKILDVRGLRFIVRLLSKAYRDSQGGSLLDRFEEISKLIFTKIYSENSPHPIIKNAFNIQPGDTPNSVYKRINSIYEEASKFTPLSAGKYSSLKQDPLAVSTCVEILQKYKFKDVPTDIKGFVYEELIKNTFDKTDNQQFFTPRTIVQFMVQISQIKKHDVLMDPACGSGGFLISALPYAKEDSKIIGLEIDPMMAWISQMNLVMNGARNTHVAHLGGGGSLSHSKELNKLVPNDSVDLIITNPPFGSDFSDPSDLQKYILGKGKKSRRRGVLFIERCLDWLKPGGKLCIVIDDGVLNGETNNDVRKLIFDRSIIQGVISLPETTFMPYATVKASILVLKKRDEKKEEIQGKVFMAQANYVGRKPNGDPLYAFDRIGKSGPELINDLVDIYEQWEKFESGDLISDSETIFTTNVIGNDNQSNRIDLPFHHPMRFAAQKALGNTKYPTKRLGELVDVRNQSTVPALQDPDENWRFIGLADISQKTGIYTVQEIIGSQLKSSVKLYRPGDILFSKMRPELQKCCYIQNEDEDGYTSAENIVLTIKEPPLFETQPVQVLGEYLALILRSELGLGQIVHQVSGVGRPRISKSALLDITIPLPTLHEQKRIMAEHRKTWTHYLNLKKQGSGLIQQADQAIETFYTKTIDDLLTT